MVGTGDEPAQEPGILSAAALGAPLTIARSAFSSTAGLLPDVRTRQAVPALAVRLSSPPAMMARMLGVAEEIEILDRVIVPVPVTVMHVFIRTQQATDFVLHQDPVKRVEALRIPSRVWRIGSAVPISTAPADRHNPEQFH